MTKTHNVTFPYFSSPNSSYKRVSIVSSPSQESCQRSIPMLRPRFKKASKMPEQILWLQLQQDLKRVQWYFVPKDLLENLLKELPEEQAVWRKEELPSKLQIHQTVSWPFVWNNLLTNFDVISDLSLVQGSTNQLSPIQNDASEFRQRVSFNEPGLLVPKANIAQRHSFSGIPRKVSDYITRKISVTKQEKPVVVKKKSLPTSSSFSSATFNNSESTFSIGLKPILKQPTTRKSNFMSRDG